ncbi:extracellular solute-binding protein [Fluviispira sanaruensis]|uniref:Fe(3+) ABC transporter substrate-binding protein n=1 Tax=Fluviispira sanaruensis TaxID=2493639 RepID=A0A4P2VMN0_FLUSA|nr:extracellular solute-binding protein [Fluviispira sanaruensis]BBH52729.1 Fe(3+) ABC transporter substrate-binding protein [Fluviispira sanaruensis]
MKITRKILNGAFVSILFSSFFSGIAIAKSEKEKIVNLYTSRHYGVDNELFAKFEKETGIKVNQIQIKEAAQLIERIKSEGKKSPADVIITVDIGNAWKAEQANLFQHFSTPTLQKSVPANLQGKNNQWYALTLRGRAIVYDKTKVNESEIQNYEDLANEKFKGRLLARTSNHVYNQSLVASLVYANGIEATENWAKKITENLARKPEGGDIDQMKAIANGKGDIAIVNTYYYARLVKSENPDDQKVVKNLAIVFPNQQNRGMHINASVAGIAKYAPHKENAIKFIEFLVSKDSQEFLAQMNNEYPVRTDVEWTHVLKKMGKPKFDAVSLTKIGENTPKAVELLDKVGWR